MIQMPEAFCNAVAAGLEFAPPSVDEFWGLWLQRAAKSNVPRPIFDLCVRAYPGRIEVRAFGGIAAILSDDFIREFTPEDVLWPKLKSEDKTGALIVWLRGHRGYVADPVKLAEMVEEETGR